MSKPTDTQTWLRVFLGDVLIKVECRKLSELATIKGVFGEKFSVLCAPATLDALRERRVMLTLISNYPEPLEEGWSKFRR